MEYTIQDLENLLPSTVKIGINSSMWNVFYYDEENQIVHLYYVVDNMLLNNDKTLQEIAELCMDKYTNVTLYSLQEQYPSII